MWLICIVRKAWMLLLTGRIYTGELSLGKGTEPQALFPLLSLVTCWWEGYLI